MSYISIIFLAGVLSISGCSSIKQLDIFTMEVERDTINKYYYWAKDIRQPVLTVHCDYENNIERIDYLMGVIYSDHANIQKLKENGIEYSKIDYLECTIANSLKTYENTEGYCLVHALGEKMFENCSSLMYKLDWKQPFRTSEYNIRPIELSYDTSDHRENISYVS
mgnify:CR=1 FL=1